jgi:pimeloyl-ACP methyl ester carboxylesterase
MVPRAARHQLRDSFRRPFLRLFSASLFGLLAAASPQGLLAQNEGNRVERVLPTADDWQIYITYYPTFAQKEADAKKTPVIILLHGDKENRLVWEGEKGLAPRLQRDGFAVITVDLRKHGQSTNVGRASGDSPAGGKNTEGTNLTGDDYTGMVEQDLEAVKKFIFEQNQLKKLNMNKIGIVGAESSAAVAVCFAGNDWKKEPYDDAASEDMKTPRGQDVRALVLLSPPQKTKGILYTDALAEVRNPDYNVAFLTLYGKLNRADAAAINTHKRLFGNTKANKDRIYLIGYKTNLRGTDLLGKQIDAESTIVEFFKLHLKDLKDSEWRDRQSRLLKK